MRKTFILLALLGAVACESETKTDVATPVPTEPTAPKSAELKDEPASAKPVEAAAPSAPLVQFEGTPHDEEHAKIELKWKSGEPVSLQELPSSTSDSVGKFTPNAGAALTYEDSVVVVTKPNELVALKGAKINGASVYDPMTKSLDDESIEIPIPEGSKLSVLKYSGEGTCFVLFEDVTYNSSCPSQELFTGDHKIQGPAASKWWVRPTGAEGWVEVDGRVDVKVGSNL